MKKGYGFLFLIFTILSPKIIARGFLTSIGVSHSWLINKDISDCFSNVNNKFNINYSIGIYKNQQLFESSSLSYGLRFFNVGGSFEFASSNYENTVSISQTFIAISLKLDYVVFDNIYMFISLEPGINLHNKYEFFSSIVENEVIYGEANKISLFTGFGVKYLFNIYRQRFSISTLMNFGLYSLEEQFSFGFDCGLFGADWKNREFLLSVEYYFGT